ncbi:hypothetical protein PUW24_07605 [Paenibacillus urinalis]|uniref:SHSP domain-containing protein n=1 Tax=Paenibacillus urinalis TaxID=521520 RepID=A0AAX3MZ66_9BACL|nr:MULTISPECIES: hypothetical protein [Paenibacillus]WDH82721.1 hypothetical protein PUW23_00065 [Paenibacillus urinalis]WDH98771.1 hypothetical protein PUW24_07605 [Paenibacillus urinalis]WDI02465.1 hypothetical protein PUW25_00065 [Paenibacillus urinalis]SDX75811.1 hypothetical protein SAMN05518848_1142 [Paenibacillus sp. PDC88]GAK43162.1 hypothetical protein TCA2_5657 [Paenibacillus sp. TCA20]
MNVNTFPVPKEANRMDRASNNPEMDYVQYTLPGVGKNTDIPQEYINEIIEWGWKEDTAAEDTSNTDSAPRIFVKDSTRVHLSLHNGYLTVLVPTQDPSIIKPKTVDSN